MLFVGDDWAEEHHDVEIVNDGGRRLVQKRLPEGVEGISRLHDLIARCMPKDWADLEPGQAAALVKIGIETERGPWVAALVAAGYEVFAINPMSTARSFPPNVRSQIHKTRFSLFALTGEARESSSGLSAHHAACADVRLMSYMLATEANDCRGRGVLKDLLGVCRR